jgi:glycerol-3-phosphate dehydrogenase
MGSTTMTASRAQRLERLASTDFDVLVLGGGINGAASAAALAAGGAAVALLDRGDYGCATSQESSNLVWGGIKYLEGLEVGLVTRLCLARNRLLRLYPSSVREIRFLASHPRGFRHGRLKLALGAWLYWLLGGFATRPPRLHSLRTLGRVAPLVAPGGLDGGFEYSDAYLPDGDARFVWGLVRSALEQGCTAANYLEALGSRREGDRWLTSVRDRAGGGELTVRSRVLINAAGPYADAINARDGVETAHRHVLSKGVHLIVERPAALPQVLAFFADDGRLFFAIPMGSRTCVGTTDTPVDSADVRVGPEDRRFVLENLGRRLQLSPPLTEGDVVAERCGVRPLVVDRRGAAGRDWMQLSRRHVIEVDEADGRLTIFGGKLTDCLNVGEEVRHTVERLGVRLSGAGRPWCGDPPAAEREAFRRQALEAGMGAPAAPGAPDGSGAEPAWERLWRRYGRGASEILEAVRRDPREGELVLPCAGMLRAELRWVAQREQVVRLEDFLRRRTQLALVVRREELGRDPGLREACRILFGEAAEERRAEYLGEGDGP